MRRIDERIDKDNFAYKPSLRLWAQGEYAFFRQGLSGLIIKDDRLFTQDEFKSTRHDLNTYQDHKDFIKDNVTFFARQNISLLLVLIPSKAHAYELQPSYKKEIYLDFLTWAQANNISLCDLTNSLQSKDEKLFFNTDTHWTPKGAVAAADGIRTCLQKHGETGPTPDQIKTHKGDLLAYVPFSERRENYQTYSFPSMVADEDDLFGSITADHVLVGTSYSANPLWQFQPALENALGATILNMAEDGLGPFEAMRKYRAYAEQNPENPKMIIWEIPERYLSLSGDKDKAS